MPLYIMVPAQLTPSNLEMWHKDYLNQYDRSVAFIRKIGGTPREKKPLTLSEFKSDLESEKNDNPKMSYGKLAIKMAKEDAWPHTFKHAQKMVDARAKREGTSYTLMDIFKAQSNPADWHTLSLRNEELKKQGMLDSHDRALTISQEYFGSP